MKIKTDKIYETIPKNKFWKNGDAVYRFEKLRGTTNIFERYTRTEKFETLIHGANVIAGSEKISEDDFNSVKEEYLAHKKQVSAKPRNAERLR